MDWLKYKVKIKPYHLAIFFSFVFFAITVIIASESYHNLKARNATLFDLRVEEARKAIEKRIVDYIQILKGVQGLVNESDTVFRYEFKEYVENLEVEKNYPGILGIGYSIFISAENKESFESKIKEDALANFQIWPEEKRPLYTSIVYIEPLNKRNQKAIGYNMYSDSVRRKAMDKARDTGNAVLSGSLILVQEYTSNIQKGFNMYLPVYKSAKVPPTLEERRKKIKGFVYSPFRVNDLMNGILQSDFDDLNILIFDHKGKKTDTLYTTEIKRNSGLGLKKNVELKQAGHEWGLQFVAAAGFGYDRDFPYFIFGGGLTISILIFIILMSFGYIQESTHLKQVITDNATAGLIILNKKGQCTFMNPSAESLTGYNLAEMENKHVMTFFRKGTIATEKRYKNDRLLQLLLDPSEIKNFETLLYRKSGKMMHVSISSKMIQQHSKSDSILIEIRNINLEKKSERALKERNNYLQTLNKIGKNLSGELELKKLLQIITDSCTSLTKAEFGAFFYNKTNDENKSLMLFTISGVDPKHFENFPAPRDTKIFGPTFHGERIIRSHDITKDPNYGKNEPYFGIPAGHLPVKSYLAVPVISRTGVVIGSLIFGHGKPGIFNQKIEEIIIGIAAQAAIAIDNSQLFEDITNKNRELIKINNDLDNFVYTASHDLKAPVLNIEGLVYALTKALHGNNRTKVDMMMEMIKKSILKFKDTIQALTEVARANKNVDEDLELVNIRELLDDIKFSIKDIIESSNADIKEFLENEEIYFSKSNLRSILINLITNSIKYRSSLRDPLIEIHFRKENENHVLIVRDNGLGIPKEHYHKIFLMFKRVHSHAEGTGIGLYLVKRIVENEGGTVSLESEIGEGTTFSIVLPEKSQKEKLVV